MLVLKFFLWALLALLALLLLLLLLPATLYLRWENGQPFASVRVLFIRLRILPAKKKPAKSKPARKKKEKKDSSDEVAPQEEQDKEKKDFLHLLNTVQRITASAGTGLRLLLKGLWIRNLELVVPVHAATAANTAIRCGQVQAAIGTTRAVLENIFRITYKQLQVYPDFAGQYADGIYFSCKIVSPPVIIVAAGVVAFTRYLTYNRKTRRVSLKPAPSPAGNTAANKTEKE